MDSLYKISKKKINYLSSTLLENKDVQNTFLNDSQQMDSMTNLKNHLDELLIVCKLCGNGTMNTWNTNASTSWIYLSQSKIFFIAKKIHVFFFLNSINNRIQEQFHFSWKFSSYIRRVNKSSIISHCIVSLSCICKYILSCMLHNICQDITQS